MAKLFITFILLFMFVCLNAQTKNETKINNSNKLSFKSGIVKERQFEEIGKFERYFLSIVTVKHLNSDKVEKFLQIRQKLLEKQDKIKILSLDEVEDLIKALTNLKDNIPKDIPEAYTELYCETISGIEIGIYSLVRHNYWEGYLTMDRTESKYRVLFMPEYINEFVSLLEKAKEMM